MTNWEWDSTLNYLTYYTFKDLITPPPIVAGESGDSWGGAVVCSCTKWGSNKPAETPGLSQIYQPLSTWHHISLWVCFTLLSLCFTLFFLSVSVSPVEAQSDFQGGVCWPSVVNKDLERQLQLLAGGWGLVAPREQRCCAQISARSPNAFYHSLVILRFLHLSSDNIWKTHTGFTTNSQLLERMHGQKAFVVCLIVCWLILACGWCKLWFHARELYVDN